jgi:hypothetical protein
LARPKADGTQRRAKTLSFSSDEQYERFSQIAISMSKNPSELCQGLADGELILAQPTHEQLEALVRGVVLLLESGELPAAQRLAALGLNSVSENSISTETLHRLQEFSGPLVGQLYRMIQETQPFWVESKNNRYLARYANFWLPPGGRPQLRAWVEEKGKSDEPPELAHNRVFRLDRLVSANPAIGEWRFDGLDTITIKLELQSDFRYTPVNGDVVSEENGKTIVTRPCWSEFWLLQDIGRYGAQVKVLSPQSIKDRVIKSLKQQLSLYEK